MRNLKRVLSLALAMVMVLGVMIVSSSAASKDFGDNAKINYTEAVDVLTGLGVLEGDEKGSFNPDQVLTREQAAKIMCYIMLGKENAEKLGANAQIFKDVAPTRWSAGYIAYCANVGLIAGSNGKFDPEGQLTGVAFAKLLLVAAGYDAKAEGYVDTKDWAMNVAGAAIDTKIDVKGVILANSLTREQAAQMVLQALEMDTVTYTKGTVIGLVGPWAVTTTNTAADYDLTSVTTDSTVQFAEKYFSGLKKTAGADDVWGRPALRAWTYTDKGTTKTLHTVMATPVASYTTAKTECDIASDLGLKTTATGITVYTNGYVTDRVETINPLATIAKMGAQGRLTEVYKVGVAYRIVYIDTYLAKVTDVVNATFDAAGHLRTSSSMTLRVYIQQAATQYEDVILYGGADNYTYTKGQMLLVNAVDNNLGTIATKFGTYGTTPSTLEIAKVADSITGAQSTIWWNVEQHTVNGTTYNDANTFFLDEAGTDTANHTWYFDLYGNLIGVTDIATQYTYGVISAMWWVNDGTNGTGKAMANLTYMDGTTATVTLGLIDDDGLAGANKGYVPVGGYDNNAMSARVPQGTTTTGEVTVSTNAYINVTSLANSGHGFIGGHMFQFATRADGTVAAYKVMNEIGGATVNKGVTGVNGTISGSGSVIYVNSDTKFLVRTGSAATGYKFTPVSDYNNIGSYTGATVDYVNTNNDYWADYVYLYGTSNDNTDAFVFINGTNFNATLRNNGGVQYFEITYGVKMDGSTSTLKVLDDGNGQPDEAIITTLMAGYGKLFKITYVNDYATTATEVTTGAPQTSGSYTAEYLGTNVLVSGNSMAVNGTPTFNTTTSTVVIGGTLDDLKVQNNGLNVYVVYATANRNVVQYVYLTRSAIWGVNVAVTGAYNQASVTHAYGTVTNGGNYTFAVTYADGYKLNVMPSSGTHRLDSNVLNGNGTSTATFTVNNITNNAVITVDVTAAAATPATLTITNTSGCGVAINGVAAAGTYNANVGDVLTLTATGNVTVTGDANVTAVMNGNMQTWTITVKGAGNIAIA